LILKCFQKEWVTKKVHLLPTLLASLSLSLSLSLFILYYPLFSTSTASFLFPNSFAFFTSPFSSSCYHCFIAYLIVTKLASDSDLILSINSSQNLCLLVAFLSNIICLGFCFENWCGHIIITNYYQIRLY